MGLNSILNFFKLDDDELDEYDDMGYEEETYTEKASEPVRKRTPARPQPAVEYDEEPKQRVGILGSKPKVVPMNRSATMPAVEIVKPNRFEDSEEICSLLRENRAVIVNLEGYDPGEAQRIMDFVLGCIYAIDGHIHPISKYIFIFSPNTIPVNGNSDNSDGNVTVRPLFNREF